MGASCTNDENARIRAAPAEQGVCQLEGEPPEQQNPTQYPTPQGEMTDLHTCWGGGGPQGVTDSQRRTQITRTEVGVRRACRNKIIQVM